MRRSAKIFAVTLAISVPFLVTAQSDTANETMEPVLLDAETFKVLEKHLADLDTIIGLQEDRLSKFEAKKLVTTDPNEIAQLDELTRRLTKSLDDLEYQREALDAQLQRLQQLNAQKIDPAQD